ncbi:hypothetical protein JDV02_002486 [Purpureocillium takamizusanense]|uniref:Acyltransferase MbtK/IucB-like conserved domain-containing protein n=1 Tax=Purpureocillium takamizusanense TaxID=2060973 RepID=A0A9Q8V7S6_9HYPO|nr:uncharacterized protein JDV02_002486 [Purpureocillium takamizusanense]UNI16008.1 hypothetical protein JDV02_002486 [Purpureocillium takamizusanense]
MAPDILHLPDGQTFDITPVFAGVGFRSHEYNTHHHPYPAGWTTVLHTEEERVSLNSEHGNHADQRARKDSARELAELDDANGARHTHRLTRPFTVPTLTNDTLFISSVANPPSAEFKPATSPTRQIAMMLWVTLYWYFHQPEPISTVDTAHSRDTPHAAKPRADWKIYIRREGILRGRNLIPKLERMGLIASEDSAADTGHDDTGDSWARMFVSKRMFWQIPGHLFLFTLQPMRTVSPGLNSYPGSPAGSRPSSPSRPGSPGVDGPLLLPPTSQQMHFNSDLPGAPMPTTPTVGPMPFPISPFFSTSHLPTYYPPAPLQYVWTDGVRHPLRPKPPRMGEVFYTRYVPSVGEYLSFRVASSSASPVPYFGPICSSANKRTPEQQHLATLSDTALLKTWHANPRVREFWGDYGAGQLETALRSRHSFPVIGLWNGIPFGYFEVYWVKEDVLGRHVAGCHGDVGDWDRGLHIMVGEEWARGKVAAWLTGLMHWCWIADIRTMSVCLEPRVDNQRMLGHLDTLGFSKERQVSFPHKQAWFVRSRRDAWEGPAL